VADKDIVATIGPTSSRDSLAALELTAQAKVPSVTLSLAEDVMKIGDNVYRPIAADTDMIPPFVAKQVESMGIKSVAFLGANTDPNALSAHDAYKKAFDDAGVETVADETYAGGDTQWSAQLAKIKQANPDVLVLSVLAQEAGNLLTATREAGVTVPIFGAAALNSQAAVDQAGDAANDVYIPDYWAADIDSAENKAFLEAYKAKYNADATRFAASAYEAAHFLAEALKKADDPNDRASVLKAFSEVTTFPVIGSDLTMKDRGAITDNPVVLHVVDGKFTSEQ
jgi:branched-chain amino acid transport system substrate-binding protein